jgi:hypothetical protein
MSTNGHRLHAAAVHLAIAPYTNVLPAPTAGIRAKIVQDCGAKNNCQARPGGDGHRFEGSDGPEEGGQTQIYSFQLANNTT